MSTISTALGTALTALQVIERQMATSSSNISNADVSGYTAKTTNITTSLSGGVEVSSVTSTVTDNLVSALASATTDASYADTLSSFYATLDTAMGTLSDSSSSASTTIASELSGLESDLATLAQNADSSTDQSQVLSDLGTLTASLRSLSDQVQSLRTQADSDIKDTVDDANTQLSTIADLNKQILAAKAQGRDTTDLEDQRNTAVVALSGDLGVSYFVDGTGSMNVYTSNGQLLLAGDTAHTLSFTQASSVSSDSVYQAGGGGTLSGITLNGQDITSTVTSGRLGADLAARDTLLPQVQDELDTLTSSLVGAVNAAYNQGTAIPAPTSLSGTLSLAAADAFSASGTVRVAVLDADSDVVAYKDIDLSQDHSVSDVLNDLNGVSGLTAYLNASGDMVVAATGSGDGVAIGTMSSAVGADGQGFSDYFGLNDLLVGDSATDVRVRDDLSSGTATLAAGALSDSATLSVGGAGVASGDGSIATALASALSASRSFSASGSLGARTTSLSGYAGDIIGAIATATSTSSADATAKSTALSTQQTGFSNQTGVDTDKETALLTQLQSEYAAAAKVIAVAQSMFQTLVSAIAS